MSKEKIWYKEPLNLFNKDNFLRFFPTADMSLTQQLNALVRFSIYLAIILFLVKNDYRFIYLPIVALGLTLLVYVLAEGKKKESFEKLEKKGLTKQQIKPETEKYSEKVCVKPNSENPFMNPLVTDFDPSSNWQSQNGLEACDVEDANVKQDMFEKYSEKLYRSTDDIFLNHHGDRQFYTMPNTDLISKQGEFAEWLYSNPRNECKSGNGLACYKNQSEVILGRV
jgi:hypothetical protein